MVTMKHVGLNVAADPLFYVSYTGSNGGLVIVNADDPGMHSSQNEQDNRNYAKFAKVPMLEPADSEEAKQYVGVALEISETYDTPVILRTTTRISHSKSAVEVEPAPPVVEKTALPAYQRNPGKYVMVPANARRRHPVVEDRQNRLTQYAETSPLNRIEPGDDGIGIITAGIAYQYAREVFPTASFLKLGLVHPLPDQLIRDFAGQVRELIVIEELEPFIEEHVKLMGIPVRGKEIFPIIDEFSPQVVRECTIAAGLLKADPVLSDVPGH